MVFMVMLKNFGMHVNQDDIEMPPADLYTNGETAVFM